MRPAVRDAWPDDRGGAIRLARRLEPFDPLWFEEPTPPEMPEEMAKVARATTIPIATGERLTTKYEFARVLETGAASILQMALGRVGGLLEGKKIAGMAETHYAQIAPHLYCGPVEGAANVQLAACSPELPDPREHPDLGRLPRRDPEDADRLAGRLRDPADRPRASASSSTRRSRRAIPTTATRAPPRAAARSRRPVRPSPCSSLRRARQPRRAPRREPAARRASR